MPISDPHADWMSPDVAPGELAGTSGPRTPRAASPLYRQPALPRSREAVDPQAPRLLQA